jgi:TPR repeat protein
MNPFRLSEYTNSSSSRQNSLRSESGSLHSTAGSYACSIAPSELTLPADIKNAAGDLGYLDDIKQIEATFEEYRKQAAHPELPSEERCEAAKILILKSDIATANISDPCLKKMKQDGYILEGFKVLKWLSENKPFSKRKGCSKAQLFLGKCYAKGLLGVRQDQRKAFKLFYQAAKSDGGPEASFQVALCLEHGMGTSTNLQKSLKYFQRAADGGYVEAMYRLGTHLLHHPQLSKQPNQGMLYLRRAAKENHVKALHELGLTFVKSDSEFTEQEKIGACKMFEQSASSGYAPAQFEMGQCYEYGWLGCPKDDQKSLTWYISAADQGYGPAELALSRWYKGGHEYVLHRDDYKAFAYAKKAADKGIPEAEYLLGAFYESGSGCDINLLESRRWYMRSASQNHEKAFHRLMDMGGVGP